MSSLKPDFQFATAWVMTRQKETLQVLVYLWSHPCQEGDLEYRAHIKTWSEGICCGFDLCWEPEKKNQALAFMEGVCKPGAARRKIEAALLRVLDPREDPIPYE